MAILAPPFPKQDSDKAEAMLLLRKRGLHAREVVSVAPYAIAWVSDDGEVMTAWLETTVKGADEVLVLWPEPGLPAFPSRH